MADNNLNGKKLAVMAERVDTFIQTTFPAHTKVVEDAFKRGVKRMDEMEHDFKECEKVVIDNKTKVALIEEAVDNIPAPVAIPWAKLIIVVVSLVGIIVTVATYIGNQ